MKKHGISTHRKKAFVFAAAALLLFAIAMSGASCKRLTSGMGKSSAGDSKSTDQLVMISPHGEETRKEMTRAFEPWYEKKTGRKVKIEWIDQGGASDDLKYIKSKFETEKDGIGIDVFNGGGIDPFVELARMGLLVPADIDKNIIKELPAELNGVPLYDKEYRWFGNSVASYGILKNKVVAAKLGLPDVKTWTDLADPKLLGWTAVADPRHSSSSHLLFELVLQRYGWEKGWEILAAVAANSRALPEHSSQVPQDAISGQLAYGMLIDTYAYSAVEQAGGDKLVFIMPNEDTIITPDPIGILKGAKNIEVAKAFIEFSLSPAGQKIWMYKKGAPGGPVEFSLNKMSNLPSLYKDGLKHSNVTVNPFSFKQAFKYSFEKGSTRWGLVDDLTGALLIENHDALVAAWKKAGPKGLSSFFKVPVSEEEGLKLAKETWGDAVKRGKIVAQWKQDAAKAYGAAK